MVNHSMRRFCVATGLLLGGLLAGSAAADGWLKDPVTGCEIWSADDPGPSERASWSGACHNGKASGRGTLTFWDDKGFLARFDGELMAGKAHGQGTVSLRNDEKSGVDTYTGTFVEGHPKGDGHLATADGHIFRGEFLDGMRHGRGTLVVGDGTVVRGEIKDGKGVGTLIVYRETEENEV